MARHEGVIEAARLAQTDAEDRLYTVGRRLEAVRDRYSDLPFGVRSFMRALTAMPRRMQVGRIAVERQITQLDLIDARRRHESLVTVDGLELDTLRSPNGSFLERISGLLEDIPIVAAHLVLVQKWLEGPELKPVEAVLREGFGGNRGGRKMSSKDADAFFRQFQTVLVERNQIESASGKPDHDRLYSGNLVTLFNKLTGC